MSTLGKSCHEDQESQCQVHTRAFRPDFKDWPVSEVHRKVSLEMIEGALMLLRAFGKEGRSDEVKELLGLMESKHNISFSALAVEGAFTYLSLLEQIESKRGLNSAI